MKFPLAYDATTSREDFVRLLRLATGGEEFHEIDGRFCGHGWFVRLTPIPPLEIEFDGLDEAAQDAFMRRFTRYYQRGGG
jgi:hypothetical protein